MDADNEQQRQEATTETEQQESRTVNLVVSWTSLLPGDLFDCRSNGADANVDSGCTGGVAATAAYSRYYANLNNLNRSSSSSTSSGETESSSALPTLVVPYVDTTSTFVQIHPLGWSLNRLILSQRLGWTVCLSSPSILTQNSVDYEISPRDISDLQTADMPLLLTNAAVPPSNSWHAYLQPVHWDTTTKLAVLSIYNANQLLNVDQIAATKGTLNFIHRTNRERPGCRESESSEQDSVYSNYVNATENSNASHNSDETWCYLPVVLYFDIKERFEAFVQTMIDYEHAPALILDISGSDSNYSIPQQVTRSRPNGTTASIWIQSYSLEQEYYHQHVLHITENGRRLSNVTLLTAELSQLPDAAQDDLYRADMAYLQDLADEALRSDPIVGTTNNAMPLHRVDAYRRCNGGECELGNLFCDALQWRTKADVAFVTSGGLRGPGWQAGNVTVSDIWRGLPFPNTICTGNFTGVSLFNLLDYSIGQATFVPEVSDEGGRLLQVGSGLRITYNPNLVTHRIVAIEVYEASNDTYVPLERLRMYSFATDSYLCGGHDPFTELLGSRLVFEGENRGTIGIDLHQDTVAEFLQELNGPYNTTLQGRLVNVTNVTVPLNLVETADSCVPGTYFNEISYSCEVCPSEANVRFLSEQVELEGVAGSLSTESDFIDIVNAEQFDVVVAPKSFPPWVELLDGASNVLLVGQAIDLTAGQQLSIQVRTMPARLEPGTALATISFSVLSRGNFPGCAGLDAVFDVFMRVIPTEKLNQLGAVRILGWILASIVVLTASAFCLWVVRHRELRIVKTMQPIFLVVICIGVFIMGLSIIPLSIDDEIVSASGADMACAAVPWLFSMGFTVSQSALFSKLWRINKLFNAPQIRRMQVHERDVIGPFLVLFSLNFSVLLVGTLVDPLHFERLPMAGEEWNTYGTCKTNGAAGQSLLGLNLFFNLCAMAIACYQAYLARNVSDEFSEGAKLGIVMFSWAQLMVVGIPVLFLIDADNPVAKYFIMVTLCFAVCESLLLFIFVPMLLHLRRGSRKTSVAASARYGSNHSSSHSTTIGRTRISGVDLGSAIQRSSGREDSASEYTSGFHSQLAAVEEEGDEVDDELLRSARSVLAAANLVQLKALSDDDNEVEDECKAEGNGIDKNSHNGVESPAA